MKYNSGQGRRQGALPWLRRMERARRADHPAMEDKDGRI